MMACVNQQPAPSKSPEAGSVHLAVSHPPASNGGDIVFGGAVSGTSHATHEACETGGAAFRHFTLTATGELGARSYFLSVSIYPYRGPDAYDLRPLPSVPMDFASSPDPLA